MAATPSILSIALIPTQAFHGSRQQFLILRDPESSQQQQKQKQKQKQKKPTTPSFNIQAAAAKLPPGVELPKVEPKFEAPFLGFTTTAEVWNSRVCMVGLVGIFIIELIINKGILQLIGVEVGKGLDLPL